MRGPRVDRAHADGEHLLALVREPLGVHDQPRQPVDEPPGGGGAAVGGGGGELRRVRVRDVVQLGAERGVVERDPVPYALRYRAGGVGDVEDDGGVGRTREVLMILGMHTG